MKTITAYVDDLKEITGSDYATAKRMGVRKECVSVIRKNGRVSDEAAIKMAEILEIDPSEILIAAAIARSEGETKKAWIALSKRAGIAATIVLTTSLMSSFYELKSDNFNCQKYTLCEVSDTTLKIDP